MADVVDLRDRKPKSYTEEFNAELVRDLARFSEGGLVTEKEIRRKYQFDEATWNALGENENLFAAIEDEKTRRVRNGALKRELSQKLVTQAPDVLGEILCSKDANPRHRIDAARALDDFAIDKAEAAAAMDRFQITINLSGDGVDHVLRFDKPINITPNDDRDDVDDVTTSTPWGLIATTKKQGDDGNGGHL